MGEAKSAGNSPVMVDLEKDKMYAFCTCGESVNQPYCDGSHKGTGFSPHVFKAEGGKAALCMCKKTGGTPFCDGSHKQ
jgi:CDGSH-type Zn-finger protein